jgi:hypothetical protein
MKKRKSKRKSKKENRNFLFNNSKKEQKWNLNKFGLDGDGKTSFTKFLESIVNGDLLISPLVKKMVSHIVTVTIDDKFVFIDDVHRKVDYYYNDINDEWIVRDINIKKYTEKMVEKYGNDSQMYILEPRENFYLIQINDSFTSEEFKKIYNFIVKRITGEDSSTFKILHNFRWYNIGGVELEKTDNNFEGNIYIHKNIKLKVIKRVFEHWRKYLDVES